MGNFDLALVHDWLVTHGGAEGVVAAILEMYPTAPIFTLAHDPQGPCGPLVEGRSVHTSFIQKLPGGPKKYQRYLALMPLAIEQFDLTAYSLIVSSSHAVAKGVLTRADQLHISYVHSPIRYAWDLQHQYLQQAQLTRGLKSWVARSILHYIRLWDLRTANGVDYFVANSNYVARRIWKTYRRSAAVIYPPVDLSDCSPTSKKEDYYITISRLAPYKRNDLIVDAFNQMPDRRLVVIGDGPGMAYLSEKAGRNIEFLGYQARKTLVEFLSRAKALIFMAEEDFGIVPVEAQACGTPVIAFGKGGVLETVEDGITGILFNEQNPNSLIKAVDSFELRYPAFDTKALRSSAERFEKARFKKQFQEFILQKQEEFLTDPQDQAGGI